MHPSFFDELEKISSYSSGETTRISRDDLPKESSWMDIGPDPAPNRTWRPPKKIKRASGGDIDDLESKPARRLMPALKAIHKLGMSKRAYRLQGHTDVQGLRVAIENRRGSVRKGKDGDGKEWRTKMLAPYGYFVGTKTKADGEPLDVYVGPHKDEVDHVFVVHQKDKDTGEYDEDKVIAGVRSKKEARELFLKHYNSRKFLGPISRVSVERLRELIASKKALAKVTG